MRGSKPRTTQQTWAKTLQNAGLVPENRNDAQMSLWESKFLDHEAGPLIDANLKLKRSYSRYYNVNRRD